MNTNTTTTLFDLNQSAASAAVQATGKDALTTDSLKLAAFEGSGFDALDYPQWSSYFTDHLRNYTGLKKTPSPAAAVAMAADAQAKAAAAQAVPGPNAPGAGNQTAASLATNKPA